MTTAANVFRSLADLIDDHQLPAPFAIGLYGKPRVQVDVAAIGWWLTALEVPEPSWHGVAEDDGGLMFAKWPPGTFDDWSFELACVSTANVKAVAS